MAVSYNGSQLQRVTGRPIPGANYVLPATDHKTKFGEAVTNFITNYQTINPDTFSREMLSVFLGRNGLRSGVSLFAFKPHPDDRRLGFFNGGSNSIALRDVLLKNKENICLAIHTAAHEGAHKVQQESDLVAKYFTSTQPFIKVGDNPIFTSLCGFDRFEDPYAYCRIEQEAYEASSLFTKEFFSAVLSQLPEGHPHAEEIRAQIAAVQEKDRNDLRGLHIRQMQFSRHENVEAFYKKAMPVFDRALSLAKEYNSGRQLTPQGRAFADKLSAEFEFGGIDIYSRAISTMGIVLGRLPQREKIDEYMNFATSCADPNKMPQFVSALIENAVPFTQQDYARLMLCTDYYKGRNITSVMPMSSFAKIGEATWVNTMLLSHGREATEKYIASFKNTPEAALINFSEVDRIVSAYPKVSLLNVGGVPIYGCSEVLDFTLKRCIHDKRISPNEYNSMRAQFSQNLSNIMDHFGYCNGTNPNFTRAILQFVNNPFVQQFPDDPTPPNEIGTVFSQSVAENLADYFEELRLAPEQGDDHEEESESPDVDAAKKEFLAGLENLRGSMPKEDFIAYIKSLGLLDCSRLPITSVEEDGSREIGVNLSEEELLAIGLTAEEIAELDLAAGQDNVSVIDILHGAGKIVVRPESMFDQEVVSEVEPSEYAINSAGQSQNEVQVQPSTTTTIKPENTALTSGAPEA